MVVIAFGKTKLSNEDTSGQRDVLRKTRVSLSQIFELEYLKYTNGCRG